MPLCSTYLHVIGDEVDWEEIKIMFAGSGRNWDGAAFFPTKAAQRRSRRQPDGAPRLAELEAKVTENRMVLNDGHFFDMLGRRSRSSRWPTHEAAPCRILDTGLRPARWNVAMTAALAELHAQDGDVGDTVRFHRYPACVLLGRSQDIEHAADVEYCRRAGIADRASRHRRRRRLHEPRHARLGRAGRSRSLGRRPRGGDERASAAALPRGCRGWA